MSEDELKIILNSLQVAIIELSKEVKEIKQLVSNDGRRKRV